jgi:nucleotide-binding universal stress UspA family protein
MEKQYKHILVPLDGSELAEAALTDALALARLSLAEVTLLKVVLPIEGVIEIGTHDAIYVDEIWQINKKQALEYLESVRDRISNEPFKVHVAVEMGPAAETIIDYARKHPVDLIVMATHGHSGLKRWVYGSVADKVLRGSHLSVLLVRSFPEKRETD